MPRFPPKVRNFIAAPHIVEPDWWRRRDAIKRRAPEFTRKSVAIAARHGIPHLAFRAGVTKMIVHFDKVNLMRRWRVSSGPTSSYSTCSFPLTPYLDILFLSSLLFRLAFFILHPVARKRGRFGPITTRPKSYVEFICRCRCYHGLLVEIRPAILHAQIPGLANGARERATVEIFYLYLISPLVRRRARCIRMIFIRACERVLLPRAVFFPGVSRWSWLLKDGSVKKGTEIFWFANISFAYDVVFI